jgi:fluoride exporter
VREVLAVIVGAIVGTGLRLGLDSTLVHHDDTFPWSTLIINLVGSFVLGVFVSRVWPTAAPWLKAGLGAGLVGTFTTFSAYAASIVTLTDAHEVALAVTYLLVSVIGGLLAAFTGLSVGKRRATSTSTAADE